MKADIVVDIETVAIAPDYEDVQKALAEYEPPANYKTPEAIARHKAKFEDNIVKKLTDDRKFSLEGKRMICCALGLMEGDNVVNIESWSGDDLSVITKGLTDYLNNFTVKYRLIGFNLKKFDLPEIAKSCAITGHKPRSKPDKWDIIDLCEYPLKGVKLKVAAKAFGIETLGLDGSSVAALYEQGNWSMIKKYNEDDVRITGELFAKVNRFYTL